jgi:hypothetical protein
MEVKVLEGQSLFDLAVQACGSVESVISMAGLNDLAITDVLIAGSVIGTPETLSKSVSEYYRMKGMRPATAVTISAMDNLRDEGIDYWAVEIDFVVQ